jgi:teichuronic acid biosynthesis glycosyltransferase TuaC
LSIAAGEDSIPAAVSAGRPRPLHVLTLTPFFPSAEDAAGGCFVAEPIERFNPQHVTSSVIAVRPLHHPSRTANPTAPADWVRFPQLPGNFGLSSAGRLLYRRVLGRVRRLHTDRPIDLIHAHSALPCGHAAALLAKHLRIPFVVTVHGLDVFNVCFTPGIAAQWRRKVSCEVYGQAATVICISRKVEAILVAGMGTVVRTAVIHNGVDPEMFSPDPLTEQSDPVILMVGNLLKGKGHELVLRAVQRIQAAQPKVQIHIIGDGPDRAQFEALAAELGIRDRVHFLGRKSRAEVAEAMRNCTVFALPSRYEGLGCVYLEAMSCGKPVIGCAGQGIDDIIDHGKNGWLIPVDGLDELSGGLGAFLRSPELREHIGAAARQTILTELTLAQQAERLAAVYAATTA